jgi:hypothetical protein
LGSLRRADLATVTRPEPLDPAIDGAAKRQARRDRLNNRKKALTAESSARWANAIIAGNDAQYRLARDAQHCHIIGLQAAIAAIEKRLAQPTGHTLTPEQRRARRRAKLPKGYPSQAERFAKQRRLQRLRAELGRVRADWDNNRVHVVEGGKRLAKTRHTLPAAELTPSGWHTRWECARYRIEANGSGDEPSATSPSPSPRMGKSACGCRAPWSIWPTPHAAATSSPVKRCFPTAATSGGPGSPTASPCHT